MNKNSKTTQIQTSNSTNTITNITNKRHTISSYSINNQLQDNDDCNDNQNEFEFESSNFEKDLEFDKIIVNNNQKEEPDDNLSTTHILNEYDYDRFQMERISYNRTIRKGKTENMNLNRLKIENISDEITKITEEIQCKSENISISINNTTAQSTINMNKTNKEETVVDNVIFNKKIRKRTIKFSTVRTTYQYPNENIYNLNDLFNEKPDEDTQSTSKSRSSSDSFCFNDDIYIDVDGKGRFLFYHSDEEY